MLLQGNLRVLRRSVAFKQGPAARLPNPARASLGESSQTRLAPALMKDKTGCSANLVVWAEALQGGSNPGGSAIQQALGILTQIPSHPIDIYPARKPRLC